MVVIMSMPTRPDLFLKLKYRNKTTYDYISLFERSGRKRMKVEWQNSGKKFKTVYSNLYYYLRKRPEYEVYVTIEDGDIYLETINDRKLRLENEK